MVQSDDHTHRRVYQQSMHYMITTGTPNKAGIPRIVHYTNKSVKIDWTHQSFPSDTRKNKEKKGC